jgi:anaerobic selenocysteine-containing dehydrogenase
MTNHWVDLKNADVFMICGANPSENHPCCWKWLEVAREERGAKIVVVDPRFNRSAARADAFSFIRPGTDIAFFGALINYAIDNNYINWEYVQNYTNAPVLVSPDFKGPGELDGLFSGYDAEKRKYDTKTWSYQAAPDGSPIRVDLIPLAPNADFPNRGVPSGPKDSNGNYVPNEAAIAGTVYGKLKEHYSRYTYDGANSIVAKVCGIDPAKFKEIAEIYVGITHKREKSGNLMYAMGLTQFTVGVEKIRAFAMLQCLLGNTGMPGGGINALRGESNVQGSTDWALLAHIIPAYIAMPNSTDNADLTAYLNAVTPKAGYWVNTPKYVKSLLVSYWGKYAKDNLDKAYELFPKVVKGHNYTHIGLFEDMYAGIIKGCIAWGQNPVVGGPNTNLEAAAMDKLDWFVAADLWDTESMNFWQRPGVKPEDNQTEVWSLPAASSVEKSGAVTNSGRLAQFRWKAVDPPGEAESDLWMMYQIMKAVKELYKSEGGPAKEALTELFWDYDEDEHGEPDVAQINMEINGFTWPDGEFSWDAAFAKPVYGFGNLKDDGTTACGNWVYSGQWASDTDIESAAKLIGIDGQLPKGADGKVLIPRDKQATEWNGIPFNKAMWHLQKTQIYWLDEAADAIYWPDAVKGNVGSYNYVTGAYGEAKEAPSSAKKINVGTYPNWAWAWPVNRRIIYNRCSSDYLGRPFAPDKALFLFDASGQNLLMKNDVNDFFAINKKGSLAADSGASPYIMNREVGVQAGRIFSNSLVEGPFPEHYEPREGPVKNALSGTQWNPAAVLDWPSAKEEPDKYGFAETGSTEYPYVATTYRVTEHWQAGQMTRNNSWLGEAMPENFVEISVELAKELGIKKGDKVEVSSVRGKVEGVAVVTTRLKPLEISDNGNSKKVHIVGMLWHFGYIGLFTGGPERNGMSKKNYACNQLSPHVGDANTTIPESKAFLVNLRKVK